MLTGKTPDYRSRSGIVAYIRCVSAARNTQTGETCAVKKVTNVFTKKVSHVLCPPQERADGRFSLSDACGS